MFVTDTGAKVTKGFVWARYITRRPTHSYESVRLLNGFQYNFHTFFEYLIYCLCTVIMSTITVARFTLVLVREGGSRLGGFIWNTPNGKIACNILAIPIRWLMAISAGHSIYFQEKGPGRWAPSDVDFPWSNILELSGFCRCVPNRMTKNRAMAESLFRKRAILPPIEVLRVNAFCFKLLKVD